MSKGKDMNKKKIIGYAIIVLPLISVGLKWQSEFGWFILALIGAFNCNVYADHILENIEEPNEKEE